MDHSNTASSVMTPEIVTVSYHDLIAFDPNYKASSSVHSPDDDTTSWPQQGLPQRIGHDAFGPHGLGIVLVSNVPHFNTVRTALLPLAAQIPHLPPHVLDMCTDPESYYQVGWSHGKEILSSTTRQPDTHKGSYYANPLLTTTTTTNDDWLRTDVVKDQHNDDPTRPLPPPRPYPTNKWPPAPHLPQLEPAFCQMGQLLHAVGCLIAQVCDVYCCSHSDARMTTTRLAPTLIQSQNANGRLLHYFPLVVPTTTTTNTSTTPTWCSWHNDHVR